MTTDRLTPIDEAQRQLVRAEGLEASMVITAGAGTGKTSLLVDRITGLLRTFEISDIVGITFTEKAAAELRDRVRHNLEQQITASGGDLPSRKILTALLNFDTARLSTIHAFAASLIRERPVEAGVDPDFSHIEDMEEDELLSLCLELTLIDPDESFKQLLREYRLFGGTFKALRELLSAFYKVHDRQIPTEPQIESVDPIAKTAEFDQTIRELAGFASEHCTDPLDGAAAQVTRLWEVRPSTDDTGSIWRWLFEVAAIKDKSGKQTNWDSKDNCRLQKQNIYELKAAVQSFLEQKVSEILMILLHRLAMIAERVDVMKHRDGLVSFRDQLMFAVDLLHNDDVRRHFRDKYKRILIDEFQDTDPLQVDIARLLSNSGTALGDETFSQIEKGKLTVVGDPKQSIYRFRQADTKLFNQVESALETYGRKVSIIQNFRSSASLVNFVNRFFEMMWSESESEIQYENIEPDISRPQPNPAPNVTLLQMDVADGESKPSADSLRSLEADSIAKLIDLIVNVEQWEIVEKNDDGDLNCRRAQYGDIAVLFPTTTKIELYTSQFLARNLPHRLDSSKLAYKRQIVVDLYNCLAAIDNPADSFSVIGALRSCFFGVSDTALALWAQMTNGKFDYRREVDGLSSQLNSAFVTLNILHDSRNTEYPDSLMKRFMSLTGGWELVLATDSDGTDYRLIEGIIELARVHGVAHGPGLRLFRRRLQDLTLAEHPPEAPFSVVRDNQVNLVTIHKSKGLEYPIVILANMDTKNNRTPTLIVDRLKRSYEVNAGSGIGKVALKTTHYRERLEVEKAEELAEKMRLLYVAMTRACDHLVLPQFIDCETKGLQVWIQAFHQGILETEENTVDLFRSLSASSLIESAAIDDSDSFNATTVVDGWRLIREKFGLRADRLKQAVAMLPAISYPSQPKMGQGHPVVNVPSETESDHSTSVGSAFHRYMAECPLSIELDVDLADKIAHIEGVPSDQLLPLIRLGLKSGVWEQVLAANRCWRELPVLSAESGGILKGRLDLLIENSNGSLTLIDWKTGKFETTQSDRQIISYIEVIRRFMEGIDVSGLLYYVRSKQTKYIDN